MKLAVIRLEAHTLLPRASPAWRNHSVSNSRAAAPDKAKMRGRTRAIGRVMMTRRPDAGGRFRPPAGDAACPRTVLHLGPQRKDCRAGSHGREVPPACPRGR